MISVPDMISVWEAVPDCGDCVVVVVMTVPLEPEACVIWVSDWEFDDVVVCEIKEVGEAACDSVVCDTGAWDAVD